MNNDDIITLFIGKCKMLLPNSLAYPNIEESDREKVRISFLLDQNETILYVHDPGNCHQNGLVITDMGITVIKDNDGSDEKITISWQEVYNVKYKELCLFFYDFNNVCTSVPMKAFGYSDESGSIFGELLAETFTEMARCWN